jgi:RNA polymerase sigma factor (sigma-70 family)
MDVFFAGKSEATFAGEWARLVRLCARLTGDASVAEDLAQETLVEAWRQRHKLQQPEGQARWLSAIARHVCRRWLSRHARRQVALDGAETLAGEDLEVELLRQEQAMQLAGALGTLPPATRELLVARYGEEASLHEIAGRMGLSEGAIKVRLHRARRQLRRAFDALSGGVPSGGGWEETTIWCPACGHGRLLGRIDRPHGALAFRCPCCDADPDATFSEYPLTNRTYAGLVGGLVRYRSAFARTQAWVHDYYRPGLAEGEVPCTNCGRSIALRREALRPNGKAGAFPGLSTHCAACAERTSVSLGGLVLTLPAVRRFWRDQRRMRLLPARPIVAAGQPALVSRVESVAGSAYLDIISAHDTYALIAVHGTNQ